MYLDILREFRYTSPSGKKFTVNFDDVERSGSKKAQINELPLQDNPDIQDLGNAAIEFSVTVYFDGPEYYEEADRFWNALGERGFGRLEHPRYGDIRVLPVSRTQTESFTTGMRKAEFRIDFVRAQEERIKFPLGIASGAFTISDAFDSAMEFFAEGLAAEIGQAAAANVFAAGAALENGIEFLNEKLSGTVSQEPEANNEFLQTNERLISQLSEITRIPKAVVNSAMDLFRLPGRIDAPVRNKIRQYDLLFSDLESINAESKIVALTVSILFNAAALATAEATLSGGIVSRADATAIIQRLLSIQERAKNKGIDLEKKVSEYFENSDIANSVNNSFTIAVSIIQQSIFNLPLERKVILQEDSNPLILTAKYYKDINRLDEFIEMNEISGERFFLLPKGTEIRYLEEVI